MATINLKGTEYELSCKLKVAFLIQKANGHKPYSEVFKNMSSMPIEKQIEMLYISWKEANPSDAATYNQDQFQSILLEDSNLTVILESLSSIVEGIMYSGMTEEQIDAKKAKAQEARMSALPGKTSSEEDSE